MMMLKMMTMMMIIIIIDHNDATLKNGEWKPFIISDPWLSKEGARPNVSPLTVHYNDDDDDDNDDDDDDYGDDDDEDDSECDEKNEEVIYKSYRAQSLKKYLIQTNEERLPRAS